MPEQGHLLPQAAVGGGHALAPEAVEPFRGFTAFLPKLELLLGFKLLVRFRRQRTMLRVQRLELPGLIEQLLH